MNFVLVVAVSDKMYWIKRCFANGRVRCRRCLPLVSLMQKSTLICAWIRLFWMLPFAGDSRCASECPNPSAEDGGGQQLQAGPDRCSEGHQSSVWNHRHEEHAGVWGVVQVQGGLYTVLSIFSLVSSAYILVNLK